MIWIYFTLALGIGVLLPFQAGMNAQLRPYVAHPLIAAIISFVVGTLGLVLVALVLRINWVSGSRLASAPWWALIGGLLGATYVLMTIVLAPRLGAAALIGLTVTGQMFASVLLDHFGLIGFPVHPISISRVIGAALLIGGVLLIQR